MLLERTISQLDIGPVPPNVAQQMGQLGYMQWIAALPGGMDYREAARRALATAQPFAGHSPAVAAFCALVQASLDSPLTPLPMRMPPRVRRGGRRACLAARAIP
ncbi:hypothetical protein ACFORG_08585 [Lutimaribacter marinistellae]|uniref:Uncharacterized protein n=1 Tax=Lutimaribacter marinistellae TaxID=1820329 RepID=A0ABV7TFM1_9RHOB